VRAPRLNLSLDVTRGAPPAALASAAVLRQRAEHAASTLPPLLVAAERIASTVIQGVHGRRRVGQGETFWQFRRYQPGDSIGAIDWRQTAKGDRVYVRENEWEAAQSVWLWCDASPSMAWRSNREVPSKLERATVLSLALASLLVRAGEQVAQLGSGQLPRGGRAVLNRLSDAFSRTAPQGAPSLPNVEPLPRHARVVIAGDLLSPPHEIERIVRGYAARGVRGALLQVLDPAEETLPFAGRVRFRGLEGEGDTLIGRVETVRDDYTALMASHRAALADLARTSDWSYVVHHTDRAPQTPLLALHAALSAPVKGER
jgi:uncharacterized protein (DUF58 family)